MFASVSSTSFCASGAFFKPSSTRLAPRSSKPGPLFVAPFRIALLDRVGTEDVEQEVLHHLGLRGFALRCDGVVARDVRLPERHRGSCGERKRSNRRPADRPLVPGYELAEVIGPAVGTRQHRLATQMALQIMAERVGSAVALRGFLLQRLEQNRVEIARELAVSFLALVDRMRATASGIRTWLG